MTHTNASSIIAGCAEADIDNEGRAIVLTDLKRPNGAVQAVWNWRKYSAEAGDLAVVEAVDTLGLEKAAEIYSAAAEQYQGDAPDGASLR